MEDNIAENETGSEAKKSGEMQPSREEKRVRLIRFEETDPKRSENSIFNILGLGAKKP